MLLHRILQFTKMNTRTARLLPPSQREQKQQSFLEFASQGFLGHFQQVLINSSERTWYQLSLAYHRGVSQSLRTIWKGCWTYLYQNATKCSLAKTAGGIKYKGEQKAKTYDSALPLKSWYVSAWRTPVSFSEREYQSGIPTSLPGALCSWYPSTMASRKRLAPLSYIFIASWLEQKKKSFGLNVLK